VVRGGAKALTHHCVCARDEIVNADGDTLTATAADIFG